MNDNRTADLRASNAERTEDARSSESIHWEWMFLILFLVIILLLVFTMMVTGTPKCYVCPSSRHQRGSQEMQKLSSSAASGEQGVVAVEPLNELNIDIDPRSKQDIANWCALNQNNGETAETVKGGAEDIAKWVALNRHEQGIMRL